jgi:hypothetical protein
MRFLTGVLRVERHWHIWKAIDRFARRHCAAATTDAGVSILLVLFGVFFLAGATIAVVFAARPFPKASATAAQLAQPVAGVAEPAPATAKQGLPEAVAADSEPAPRAPGRTRNAPKRPEDEATATLESDALGLRLSRASDVLRQQLALGRGVGLVVDGVSADSFAARAGFKRNDVLVSLDDQLLLFPAQVPALFEVAGGEAPCRCRLLRSGKPLTITLSLRPTAMLTAAVAAPAGEPDPAAPTRFPAAGPALTDGTKTDSVVPVVATPRKPAPESPRKPVIATPSKLRVPASVVPPSVDTFAAETKSPRQPKAGLLMRVSEEALFQQDSDYQIKVTGGSEKRLVVRDSRGRIIFNDAIETPEQRSLMPLAVRDRVERMERLLTPPTDASGNEPGNESGDEPATAAAEAVVRGPEAARIEWRPVVTRAAGDRSDIEATGGRAEAAIEIGRLDIEPVEIR